MYQGRLAFNKTLLLKLGHVLIFNLVDSGLTRSRSIRSRSDSCERLQVKRAAGLSQARRILIRRLGTRASGRSEARDGGGRRRTSPARPNLGFPASVWRADCV
jgi:hypothetical protein